MVLKTFEVLLDIEKDLYSPTHQLFQVSKYDFDSVEIQFTLNQDDAALDLTGTTVELAVKKPSGLTVYQLCEITSALEGKAIIKLSIQAYVEQGIHMAEIYVRNVESMAVTSPFYFSSRDAIMETEEIESENDWSAFQQALFAYDFKPLLVEGIPTEAPDYVGQMAFDTTNKRVFIANGLLTDSWQLIEGGGGGGIVSWADILNKPTIFPPELHSHLIADITGLQTTLDGKADDADLTGKADVLHSHSFADITAKPLTYPAEPHLHDYADIENTPATYPPTAHSHAILDVTGLQTTLDGKADDLHSHTFADITAKPTAYPAEAHNHLWAEITDKPTTFTPAAHVHDEYLTQDEGDLRYDRQPSTGTTDPAGAPLYIGQIYVNTTSKEAFIANSMLGDWQTISADELGGAGTSVEWIDVLNKPSTFTPSSHNHLWAEITDKPTTFTPAAHTHLWADLTDKPTTFTPTAHNHLWAEITDKPTTFPAEVHSHAIADITNLETTLNGLDKRPIRGAGAPTIIPDYVAQMYLNETTGDAYIANGLTAGDWRLISDNDVDWTEIINKPTTFPPDTHSHTKADITDFAHTHTKADITDFAHAHLWADITDKPTTFTPEAHAHAIADVTNLETTLAGKDEKPITGVGAPTAVPAYVGQLYIDTTAGEAYVANGTTAATWEIISDNDVDWTEILNKPATYPPDVHAHAFADITAKPATYPPPLASVYVVGGARTGNGLMMSGEYMTIRGGVGIIVNPTTYAVDVDRTQTDTWYPAKEAMGGLSLWKGTQAEYDAIGTKDPDKLYFIVG